MTYAILRSIHLLAIIGWVGGMFFTVHCLRPAAAALEPPMRVALMQAAIGRFLRVVMVAVVAVVLTGVAMIVMASRVSSSAGLAFNMPADWHVMVALGTLMIVIFGYIRFALFERLNKAAEAKDWPRAAAALALTRTLVGVNLGLAVVIVVVTRLGGAV